MALERRDPVPAGRYSVFVLDAEQPVWLAWLKEHAASVRPLLAVPKTGGSTSNGTSTLFEVSSPTPWVKLGLPTIEPRSAQQWLLEERARHSCYWVWTEAGPSVVCDETGPARISLVTTVAPWLLAAFFGYVFINRQVPRRASTPRLSATKGKAP